MLESRVMDIATLKPLLTKAGVFLAQAGFVVGSVLTGVHLSLGEVKAGLSELKVEVKELRSETKADIAVLRSETKADIAALRSETKADIAALRSETKADIKRLEDLIKENNQHTDRKIDGLNQRMDQLHELLLSLQSSRDKTAVKVSALSADSCLICVPGSPARQPVHVERLPLYKPATAFSIPFLISLTIPETGMNSRQPRPSQPLCAARGFIAALASSLIVPSCASPWLILSAGLASVSAPGFSASQGGIMRPAAGFYNRLMRNRQKSRKSPMCVTSTMNWSNMPCHITLPFSYKTAGGLYV